MTVRSVFRALPLILSALVLVPEVSLAADGRVLYVPRDPKVDGYWSAYTLREEGNLVCYVVSQPTQSDAQGRPRGEVYALITHRPAESSFNVPSFVAGYSYEEGSEVAVAITRGGGEERFTLFTAGDTAWAHDDETDAELTSWIARGSQMVVRGTSSRGTTTVDTYSLKGSLRAIREIDKACGYTRP